MTPNGMVIIIMFLFLLFLNSLGQSKAQLTSNGDNINNNMYAAADVNISFRPSVAVVIGILSVMFSLTFLLLIYAKNCHSATSSNHTHRDHNNEDGSHNVFIPITNSRSSGVDKALIESLPMFKFSTLKGSKDGLECAVCLSKFEDVEILRLLPKCKHAFHINCVDKWLESHSSCPLCRRKVDANDLTLLKLSNSSRLLSQNLSSLDLREDSNFELFIKREPSEQGTTSSRFSIGSSFRRNDKRKKDIDDELLLQEINVNGEEDEYDKDGTHLDKFKHKIMISDIFYKNRWSDVKPSDLMFLNSEMLNNVSSKRFSTESSSNRYNDNICIRDDGLMTIKEEMERKRMFEKKIIRSDSFSGTRNFLPPHPTDSLSDSDRVKKNLNSTNSKSNLLVSSSKRSMSEITSFSRYGMKEISSSSSSSSAILKDERRKKIWLPIARRTVQWIAGREGISPQHEKQDSLV